VKYSIILPYIDRLRQFISVLHRFHDLYDRDDFELVVLIDSKNDQSDTDRLIVELEKGTLRIKYLEVDQSDVHNPSKSFNTGARIGEGQYVVLSNPECYHKDKILSEFDRYLETHDYVVAACEECADDWEVVDSELLYNHVRWLQHPNLDNRELHFCSVLSKENFLNWGGFDEEYCKGISYDDDDFLRTVRKHTDSVVSIPATTVHLWHDRDYINNQLSLVRKNEKYFRMKWSVKRPRRVSRRIR